MNTRNVLSSDVEIVGTVKFEDDLIVDGKIEGEIQSTGNLTIGENAVIKAEVETGTIMVYGKVHGNLTATDKIELKASSEVVGDIKAKVLMIEAGAIFVGKSTVGTPSQSVGGNSEASRGDAGRRGDSSSLPEKEINQPDNRTSNLRSKDRSRCTKGVAIHSSMGIRPVPPGPTSDKVGLGKCRRQPRRS